MSGTASKKERTGTRSSGHWKAITATNLLIIVFAIGLGGGLAEVMLVTSIHLSRPIMNLSRDYVWMAPLAVLSVTLAASAPFVALSCFRRRLALVRLTLISSFTIVLFNLFLFIHQVHDAVLLAMAATLSTVVSVPLALRLNSLTILAKKSIRWLLLAAILPGAIMRGSGWLSENRSISDLPPARVGAPNIILVTLDTVRAANLSLYGYSRKTTPRLEAFARDGVVFEHALSSAPWTLPSHATMFTGRWHHELSTDWASPLDDTFPTLAAFLSSHGYLTAGFVANTSYCSYESGLDRGFVHYEDFIVSPADIFNSTNLREVLGNWRLEKSLGHSEVLARKSAGVLNSSIFNWLEEKRDRPYFLFVNYFDAHIPYLPPPPYDRAFGPPRPRKNYSPLKWLIWMPPPPQTKIADSVVREERDAYDGVLKYLDDQLGELIDRISRLGQLDNTLIIITSDHGEEFGEHVVFGHGNSLYRPSLEVPLVLRLPGKIPRGIRVGTPVTVRDLAATVVDLAGLSADSPFPGQSLSRYWNDEQDVQTDQPLLQMVRYAKGNPDWFPVSKGDMHSVVWGGLHYILNGDGAEELYDFDRDPWEKRDLAALPEYGKKLKVIRGYVNETLQAPNSVKGNSK